MDRIRSGLVLLLISGGAVAAHAQGAANSIAVVPQDIVWKAPPVSPGPETAVIFGDPTKPGPYVLRAKFPAGFKLMPHTHPDEWRTGVVLSGNYYFGIGEQWDESKLRSYPPGHILFRAEGYTALRLGEGRRGDRSDHRDGPYGHDADPAKARITVTTVTGSRVRSLGVNRPVID